MIHDTGESIEIMPQDQFNTIEAMEFDLNTLMGVTWREGVKKKERILKAHGSTSLVALMFIHMLKHRALAI